MRHCPKVASRLVHITGRNSALLAWVRGKHLQLVYRNFERLRKRKASRGRDSPKLPALLTNTSAGWSFDPIPLWVPLLEPPGPHRRKWLGALSFERLASATMRSPGRQALRDGLALQVGARLLKAPMLAVSLRAPRLPRPR